MTLISTIVLLIVYDINKYLSAINSICVVFIYVLYASHCESAGHQKKYSECQSNTSIITYLGKLACLTALKCYLQR